MRTVDIPQDLTTKEGILHFLAVHYDREPGRQLIEKINTLATLSLPVMKNHQVPEEAVRFKTADKEVVMFTATVEEERMIILLSNNLIDGGFNALGLIESNPNLVALIITSEGGIRRYEEYISGFNTMVEDNFTKVIEAGEID